MTQQYVQGDVMFVRRDGKSSLTNPVKSPNGKHILARGEKTGHTHTVDASAVDLFEVATGKVVVVKQPVFVYHQEHDPLELPLGEYDVIAQRQYTAQEAPRRVYD